MWAALWAILAAIAAWITWRIQSNPRRRKERLLKRIRKLQDELAQAVAHQDGDAVSRLNAELVRLRQESSLSA